MRLIALAAAALLVGCGTNTPGGGSSGASTSAASGTGASGTSTSGGSSTSSTTTTGGSSSTSSSSSGSSGTSGGFNPVVGDCNAGGWCWMNPLPQGNTLLALTGTSDQDVWAAGVAGTLRHWDGQRWTTWPALIPDNVVSIAARAPDDVWAVSGYGTLHFDGTAWALYDAGYATSVTYAGAQLWALSSGSYDLDTWSGDWNATASTSGAQLFNLYGLPTGELFAGGDGLWLLDDAGLNLVNGTTTSQRWDGRMAGRGARDMYFVSASANSLQHWDGQSFARIDIDAGPWSVQISALAATDRDVALVNLSDTASTVQHLLLDGGSSWQPTSVIFPTALWGPRAGEVDWVAGEQGQIEQLGGPASTQGITANVVDAINAPPWMPRRDLGFIPGGSGVTLFDGSHWTQSSTFGAQLIAGASDTDGLAIEFNGSKRWDGTAWTAIANPPTTLGVALAAQGSGKYLLVAADGAFEFDGTQWSAVAPVPFVPICVAASGPTDAWAAGYTLDGGANVAHFDGSSWTVAPTGVAGQVNSVADVGGEVWIAGPDLLARLEGGSWRLFANADLPAALPQQGNDPLGFVSAVAARGAGDVWVALDGLPWALHWDGAQFHAELLPGIGYVRAIGLPPTGETFLFGEHGEILFHPQ